MNEEFIEKVRYLENFIIGEENFSDLEINHKTETDKFYYFKNKKTNKLIKQFILKKGKIVDYMCAVTLIKNDKKFSPHLIFSIRTKSKGKIKIAYKNKEDEDLVDLKARIDLNTCHKEFWELIKFLQTFSNIEAPTTKFSVISEEEQDIIRSIQKRSPESIVEIGKKLLISSTLTQKDINSLLKIKEKLIEFEASLMSKEDNEAWWQKFFEENKWIFGYGLNYEILKEQTSQPNYGGAGFDRKGGQKGDYLESTVGDLCFTVLVEIKTPKTPLLQGVTEIRNGAWSLSKNLTDTISQIQANIQTWENSGSREDINRDKLEEESVYTIKPKGIIVIGNLKQLKDNRHKWETFQRFRKSIHGIEIITFDELYNRAKFIVENE